MARAVTEDLVRRVLVVSSGHAWSTLDVYTGLVQGFKDAGYETFNYDLHTRLEAAEEWLKFAQQRFGRPGEPEPTENDVLYQAGCRAVVKALECNVDAVVVTCGLLFEPRLYVLLERAGIPVFLFGTESPYDDAFLDLAAPLASAVSLNEPSSAEALAEKMKGTWPPVPVVYMPLGFNAQLHKPGFGLDSNLPSHDVVFVGNIYPSRQQMIESMDWTDIDLAIYGVTEVVAKDAKIRKWVKHPGAVPNPIVTGLYNKAKIVLNLFRVEQFGREWEILRDDVKSVTINPRLIEAAACGRCIVSEWRPQVEEVFGDAVPTFRTPQEGTELIRRLLADPAERERLGAAARQIVLDKGYDYADRAVQIAAVLNGVKLRSLTNAA